MCLTLNLSAPGATVTSRLAHRDESAILIKSLGPLPVRRLPAAALGRAYGRRRCSWVPGEVSPPLRRSNGPSLPEFPAPASGRRRRQRRIIDRRYGYQRRPDASVNEAADAEAASSDADVGGTDDGGGRGGGDAES